MKLNLRLTSILCAIFFLSISCSKDKSIERQIQKNDGIWNIDNVTWSIVEQSTSGQSLRSGSDANAGTFTFESDGSGKYSYTIDGTVTRSGSFTWTVDDGEASIISATQSINYSTFAVTQKTVAYTGTQPSKTKLTLEGSETDQSTSGTINQFVITATFTMSRK
jgi:hypothetical protein